MLHFLGLFDVLGLRGFDGTCPAGISSANRVITLRPPLDEQPIVLAHFNLLSTFLRALYSARRRQPYRLGGTNHQINNHYVSRFETYFSTGKSYSASVISSPEISTSSTLLVM